MLDVTVHVILLGLLGILLGLFGRKFALRPFCGWGGRISSVSRASFTLGICEMSETWRDARPADVIAIPYTRHCERMIGSVSGPLIRCCMG